MNAAPEDCIFRSILVIQCMVWFEKSGSQGCIKFVVQRLVIWAICSAESCLETLSESTQIDFTWCGKLWPHEIGCGGGLLEAVQSPYLNWLAVQISNVGCGNDP